MVHVILILTTPFLFLPFARSSILLTHTGSKASRAPLQTSQTLQLPIQPIQPTPGPIAPSSSYLWRIARG